MAVSRILAGNGGWPTALTVQAPYLCDRTDTSLGVRIRSTPIHSPRCAQRWMTFSADARAETRLQVRLALCDVWLVLGVKDGLRGSWSNPPPRQLNYRSSVAASSRRQSTGTRDVDPQLSW